MTGEIELRGYRADDIEALYALDLVCFAPPFRFSRPSMKKFVESSKARVVIAESGAEIIGFAIMHVERVKSEGVGYVVTLDVAPEQRRKGLATVLMQWMKDEAVAAGCAAMALHVSPENSGAVRFYERHRYALSHTEKDFYARGVDALVYRQPLLLNT